MRCPIPSACTLFVDFDHTLYDSDAFLRGLHRAMAPSVSWRRFHSAFERLTESSGDVPYDPAAHLEHLLRDQLSPEPIGARLAEFVERRSGAFLYDDAKSFLDQMRSHGCRVELLTYSKRDVRLSQLRSADIMASFDAIHIFENSRGEKVDYAIGRSTGDGQHILLDDHPRILQKIEGTHLSGIRIRRKVVKKYIGREPVLPNVSVVENLTEAESTILAMMSQAQHG